MFGSWSLPGVVAYKTMLDDQARCQFSGFLHKKPVGHSSKTWQKRFFVIKDGFLLYYDEAEKKSFEKKKYIGLHPKGIIPLGDCTVSTVAEEGQAYVLSVYNSVSGEKLYLATETEVEQQDWLEILTKSTRITWRNAHLGDALIQQLQLHGSRLVEERQDMYEKLHLEVRSLSEEKQRTEELERVNEELEIERQRMETMSFELNDEFSKVKEELQTTANAMMAVEREKEDLLDTTKALELQLKILADAKAEMSKAVHRDGSDSVPVSDVRPAVSPTASITVAVLPEQSVQQPPTESPPITELERKLRNIEEEMEKIIVEKADAEKRVQEKEQLARQLEDEKCMYSDDAKRLQESLEAIAIEKQTAESDLRLEISTRLAAEDRLLAAEQAVNDLEQRLNSVSYDSAANSSDSKVSCSSSDEVSLRAELKEKMICSVKSLKVYFNHIITEQAVEASRPTIMKNSATNRRRRLRAQSMRIVSLPLSSSSSESAQQAVHPGVGADPTVKLRRAATLLLRDPALRRTAISVVTAMDSQHF